MLAAFVVCLTLASTDAEVEKSSLFAASVAERGRPEFAITETLYLQSGAQLLLSAQGGIGIGWGIDLGLKVDHTLLPLLGQGSMTALHVLGRKVLSDTGRPSDNKGHARIHTTFTADLSAAWFPDPAPGAVEGPRWLGMRNYNAELGCTFSSDWLFGYFLRTSLLFSLNTHPGSLSPLTGPPPSFDLGAAFAIDFGSEIHVGNLQLAVGVRLMVHGRVDDETVSYMTFAGAGFG